MYCQSSCHKLRCLFRICDSYFIYFG